MTTPADETGWCLTSLHNFESDTPAYFRGGASCGVTTQYVYVANVDGISIDRIHRSGFTVDSPWVSLDPAWNMKDIVCDLSGNVYALNSSDVYIAKILPDGTIDDTWASIPGFGNQAMTFGGDGNLYVIDGDETAVYKVALDATVTHIAALDTNSDEYYDHIGADSAGNVWLILSDPPSGSPSYGVDTVLRRYRPAVPDVTDIAIQPLVNTATDGNLNAFGGLHVDDTDHVIVPMQTWQANRHSFDDALFRRVFPNTGDAWDDNTGNWTFTNCAHAWISDGLVRVAPNAGVSSYKLQIPLSWYFYFAGQPLKAEVLESRVPNVGGVHDYTVELKIINSGGVLASSSAVDQPAPGTSLFSSVAEVVAPSDDYIALEIEIVKASGTFTGGDDPAALSPGIEVLSLQQTASLGLLEAKEMLPNLSWFLRVAVDGTATRIAGTWDYGGSPPPDPTSAENTTAIDTQFPGDNIQDGPLDTSLARDISSSTWGMAPDRKSMLYLDLGGRTVTDPNLLRTLARCLVRVWFEYRHRWPQFHEQLVAGDRFALVFLEERDRELEARLAPLNFHFPHAWSEVTPDLLSGDPSRVTRGASLLEDRDVALESVLSGFNYPYRWPDLLAKLRSDSARDRRQAVSMIEERDRQLEDHLYWSGDGV